ncbi:MAG: HD domain-containing protein [Tenericutes bacterium]|nr:HD domain-containing protein [Mycoplasmatota bacterium]
MNKKQVELIEKAKTYAKSILENDYSGHDFQHVLRVYKMALKLSRNKDVNLFIVSLAALLHDLDDYKISDKDSSNVKDFLLNNNIQEAEEIKNIINNMSYSTYVKGNNVSNLEGYIVQDADRLDAIGAIGIARCFAYSGYKNRSLYNNDKDDESSIAHFYQKLLRLQDLINTEAAEKIAVERTTFMKNYLEQFYKEWDIE